MDYTPIDCSLHDRYLALASQRTVCTITYRVGEEEREVAAVIQDVYTKAGAEYMQLSTGEVVRLDRVVQVAPLAG